MKIIYENIDKIREICRQHHILSLSVFGSVLTEKF